MRPKNNMGVRGNTEVSGRGGSGQPTYVHIEHKKHVNKNVDVATTYTGPINKPSQGKVGAKIIFKM